MKILLASIRLAIFSILICCVAYPLAVGGFAVIASPHGAEGSLVRASDGTLVGSSLVGQVFSSPIYFWPRPSAVEYNAAAAGGSNLSPASEKVRDRGAAMVALHGATPERPLPADLATASGSGLDPHISLEGALFQAPRVASARGLALERVRALAEECATSNPLAPGPIVSVLRLNLALDAVELNP
jgi:potassium-transporting ATPase KdpC subunit